MGEGSSRQETLWQGQGTTVREVPTFQGEGAPHETSGSVPDNDKELMSAVHFNTSTAETDDAIRNCISAETNNWEISFSATVASYGNWTSLAITSTDHADTSQVCLFLSCPCMIVSAESLLYHGDSMNAWFKLHVSLRTFHLWTQQSCSTAYETAVQFMSVSHRRRHVHRRFTPRLS